jgi:arylsulfatase A-like enzyme
VAGTISVDVSAADNSAISLVKLYKDGVLFGQDALPPYNFLWSTALEVNGSYTFTAVAIDSGRNRATSQPVKVTVSNPAVTAQPNIVVVLTDDQRWDTMQYMPLTNSLLYADSVRFTNAIAAVPLCCPSRASILTGLYSHNHGVKDNIPPYGGAPVFDDSSTIATWLDRAGYQTGLFGKYLNYYYELAPDRPIPAGWDQFYAFLNNNGNYYNYSLVENGVTIAYGNQPGDYATDVITDKAIQFITSADPAQPVFVYLAPFAPHSTTSAVDSYPTPGSGDAGTYAHLSPWRPASHNEADVSDKPRWVQDLPLLTPAQIEKGDQFRIKQLESLLAVDRAVGKLVETLVQTGRYENTVFVFLSDNGLSWGEHRWNVKKWCAYEECIRIPFWIRAPGAAGREDDSLVNDVDLAPTLAEFAGARPPAPLNGASLVDLIEDPLAPRRMDAYTEYISPVAGGAKMMFRAVRTSAYFYAEYDNGDREFYDLLIDPLQEVNRASDPGYSQTVSDLQKLLRVLKDE